MENNSLTHVGVKGMKWGVRKAEPYADSSSGQSRSSTNPYTQAVRRNTVTSVNRLSQMAIAGGLTYGAARLAKARGKKVTAAALATIGTVTVAGLGGVMVSDFVRNNTRDLDAQHSELAHAGVKGMRWGVRRYQNKDGSLTPAGKQRYDRDVRENNAKKKDNRIVIDGPDADRWVREDTRRAKGVVDSSHSMVRELKNMNDAARSKPKKQTMDLSKMSDQEMRNKINRAMLEKQYNDMFVPQKTSKGRERVGKVLETTGTVLAIGSSALGIALAIKELKG